MLRDYKILFSVTREDSAIEKEIIEIFQLENVLCIASAGDTALNLRSEFGNNIEINLLDFNAKQLKHVEEKIQLLQENPNERNIKFNIENASETGLNQCGAFETLFRQFRAFVYEFCIERKDLEALFNGEKDPDFLYPLFNQKYWSVAFELFFSETLLKTMFGEDAVQYAGKGSYPTYFRQQLEQGLTRKDYMDNYFLHHIFLGKYLNRKEALPEYLNKRDYRKLNLEFNAFEGVLQDYPDLPNHDLIQLSNLFDWMSPEARKESINKLKSEMKTGAILLIRKLNNKSNLKKELGDSFYFHERLEKTLLYKDRSLFYNEIIVAQKI